MWPKGLKALEFRIKNNDQYPCLLVDFASDTTPAAG